MSNEASESKDFIRRLVEEDIENGRFKGRVHTRFPPEPNAYPQLGHSYAALFNFRLAKDYGGSFNLRFDDTNPLTEEQEYVDAFLEDLEWLGIDWGENLFFASDYFEKMYEWAVQLVKQGDAYVDDLSSEEIRQYRGSFTAPGKNSPFRDRSESENLDLLERMRSGEFPDGKRTLRAKIDMTHPNQNMRDPVMYRILHAKHYRRGDKWCIYPSYDWAHGLEDSIEGITHSICSIEFENHRPLYDWFLDRLGVHHPQQIEFARVNLTNTILSKRKTLKLMEKGLVEGFDDPRLPTLRGMRRRGYTPEALRDFLKRLSASKTHSTAHMALLEHCIRDDLNKRAPRRFGVLRPLKVVISNYPEGKVEHFDALNNPEDEEAGTRPVPFSRELYIEEQDFMEKPVKKFYRLAPGREVRLRWAYFITCDEVVKDDSGNLQELVCSYDPATKGGDSPDGRRPKATLHWVSVNHALDAEVRLYDKLFTEEDPEGHEDRDFTEFFNHDSLEVMQNVKIEPSLKDMGVGLPFQFERIGYFTKDKDSTEGKPVLNRTVSLRDTWKKIQKKRKKASRKGSGQ